MLKKFFFITILLFIFFSFVTPFVLAVDNLKFKPQIGIGEEFPAGVAKKVTGTTIGEYIAAFYQYFIGAIAILAVVMIMWGGFLWLTAAGNTSQIGVAKTRIGGALIGLVLALSSYLLLNTINPKLVKFEPLEILPVERILQDLEDLMAEKGMAEVFCRSEPQKWGICGDVVKDTKGNPCLSSNCGPLKQGYVCVYSNNFSYWWEGSLPDILRTIFGGTKIACLKKLYFTSPEEKKEKVLFDKDEICGSIIEKPSGLIARFFGTNKKIVVGSECVDERGHCVINLDDRIEKYDPPRPFLEKREWLGSFLGARCFY